MKLTLAALCTFTLLSAVAEAKLPTEIERLTNRPGLFTSVFNGKYTHDNGTNCTIEDDEFEVSSVRIKSFSYFLPVAHLVGASRRVSNGVVTYVTTENGKRPGGSVCGDYTPLTSYTKSVIVQNNSLTILQQYSCGFFERNEMVETCTLR